MKRNLVEQEINTILTRLLSFIFVCFVLFGAYLLFVFIEIVDSGIGLKYNEASEVFSRFYRGNEGSGKASGTGLGLPVAKAIVDAHGGNIVLTGENGEGTTAIVTLPCKRS